MDPHSLIPAVRRMMNLPPEAAVMCRELSVHAAESRVFEVAVDAGAGPGGMAIHAALKRFTIPRPNERVRRDVDLTERLLRHGVSTPRVLAASADEGLLLIEWAGSTTLADLLTRKDPVGPAVWTSVVAELARLHAALDREYGARQAMPAWTFSAEQRAEWAAAGLEEWRRWLDKERMPGFPSGADRKTAACASRLAKEPMNAIIWGDCNPRNVMIENGRPRFIDFQLKRSSLMLDLVLLFSFADEPETYIPAASAHEFLSAYHAAREDGAGSPAHLQTWYDDELLWRLLVYGGNLLRGGALRTPRWSVICRAMLPDLRALL